MDSKLIELIFTGLSTLLVGFFSGNYWKNRQNSNNNSTKVRLAEINQNGRKADEWEDKYNEVAGELHEVSAKLREFVTGLKVLFSAIIPQMEGKPEIVNSMKEFVQMVDNSKYSEN